jgi:protein O-mannosyl-transferase
VDTPPKPGRLKFSLSRHPTLQTALLCSGLVVVTVLAYWRVGGFEFLDYDDFCIFFQNALVRKGFTWGNLVWGATTCYYEYWHPLMWWSHELDCQLFGLNPGAHHLVSLGFHCVNSLLVFAVFKRMTGFKWRSYTVAALFALHPLHVESVAWLAERKDLLSTMFWLLSVWAYAIYAEMRRSQTPKPRIYLWLAWFLFLIGLLSKPMVVTLPFVLMLFDYWPLDRIADWRLRISDLKTRQENSLAWLLWEKWPFWLLSSAFCVITAWSSAAGNHIQSSQLFPLQVRLRNVPVAYALYFWKTIWPANLAVLYPMPSYIPLRNVLIPVFDLLVISWVVFVGNSRKRYLTVGWLSFLGTLLPTIGIVAVGVQSMADRYMYVPSIGLFCAAVWAGAEFSAHWRYREVILATLALVVLTAFGIQTSVQVQYWRNTVTLWKHCLATGSESLLAHYCLGHAYLDRGANDLGIAQFRQAVEAAPENPEANQEMGSALTEAGRAGEATNYLAKALTAVPDYEEAHENMGFALVRLRDLNGAAAEFSLAIRQQPGRLDPYAGLGEVQSAEGHSEKAIEIYQGTLKLEPAFARAYSLLGIEYLKQGMLDEAVSNFEMNIQFSPARIEPRLQLAQIYSGQGKPAQAVAEYNGVLQLNPDLLGALNNLAWVLSTASDTQIRNGPKAVQLATRACDLTAWKQTVYIGTLAAAYAQAGDFDKAVTTAQKACDLASAHGEKELLQKNQELLQQYKRHEPVREPN